MKSNFLSILFIACFLSCKQFKVESKETTNKITNQPNIIFIVADDLGAGDLHVTGHPYAKTPNLDELAETGLSFEKAYMAAAWCAPSRYALMSGQYPAREFNNTQNLDPKQPSTTSVLKNVGYKTVHFGKWHLTTKNSDFGKQPKDFGIDEYFMTNWKGNKIEHTWSKEEQNKEYWRAHSTDYYVNMAIDFIEKNNSEKASQPFYMNLWIYPTHSYIHPTPEQLAVYEGLKVNYEDFSPYQQEFLKFVAKHGDINKSMQAYCADITAMDKALGRLFLYLKAKGIDQNTMIVFTSDNGPGPLTKQVNTDYIVNRYKEQPDLLNSVGSASLYKERKLSLHEGGIRVPFIVNWAGKTPEGVIDNKTIIQGVDWLPTVAAIGNATLPEGIYDGIDLTKAFLGNEIERKAPLFWQEKDVSVILKGPWKGYLSKPNQFQLYNIDKDPSEINNLKSIDTKIAAELEKELRNWSKNIAL